MGKIVNEIIIASLIMWLSFRKAYSGDFRERAFGRNGNGNGPCIPNQFRCLNNVCISRHLHCNGVNNCDDNSDEEYCGRHSSCPSVYPFYECNPIQHIEYDYIIQEEASKCIPVAWKCDGYQDCRDGGDERGCENAIIFQHVEAARKRAAQWILNQDRNLYKGWNKISTDRWGPHLKKTSVALYLANSMPNEPLNITQKEMAYELNIQLLSKLAQRKLKDVSSSEISSFINALLVTCQNPRKFHSLNLVKELRSRVNAQNYTIPYDLLTLCNADEKITETDVEKIKTAFHGDHREFWTETQAIVVMALACAGNQPGSSFSLSDLPGFTLELKQKQYRNGTVENLQTTALVMQALFASESEDDENNFDEEKALRQILLEQKADGSFGSVVNTYYVLPVLNYRSLANVSSDHCAPYAVDEETALQELLNLSGSKIRVRYSLWIGDERDVERTLKMKVPANTSFYEIMEIARDIDNQFRFQYVMKRGKPYVNAISGIQDDPESGKFWFPYVLNGTKHSPVTGSPSDLILKDNEHVVMWYQSGSWID